MKNASTQATAKKRSLAEMMMMGVEEEDDVSKRMRVHLDALHALHEQHALPLLREIRAAVEELKEMQARAYVENEEALFTRDPAFFGVTKEHRRLVTEAARVGVPRSALDDIIGPRFMENLLTTMGVSPRLEPCDSRASREYLTVARDSGTLHALAAQRVEYFQCAYSEASTGLVLRVSGAVEGLFLLELAKKTELVCAALQQDKDMFDASTDGGRARKAHLLRASRLRIDEADLRRALRMGKAFAVADGVKDL